MHLAFRAQHQHLGSFYLAQGKGIGGGEEAISGIGYFQWLMEVAAWLQAGRVGQEAGRVWQDSQNRKGPE